MYNMTNKYIMKRHLKVTTINKTKHEAKTKELCLLPSLPLAACIPNTERDFYKVVVPDLEIDSV